MPARAHDPVVLRLNAFGALLDAGGKPLRTRAEAAFLIASEAKHAAQVDQHPLATVAAAPDTPFVALYTVLRHCNLAGFTRLALQENTQPARKVPIALLIPASASLKLEDIDPTKPSDRDLELPDSREVIIKEQPAGSRRGDMTGLSFRSDGRETAVTGDWEKQLAALLAKDRAAGGPGRPALVVRANSRLKFSPLLAVLSVCQEARFQVKLAPPDDLVREDRLDLDRMLDDIGTNPDLPTDYKIERIEDVQVPGPVSPKDGIDPLPPLPPPPGVGVPKPGGQGGGFGGRSGATREKMLRDGGGTARSEAAVAAGLNWLVAHQANDGHWGLDDFHIHGKCNCSGVGGAHDVGGTALGLLPLLGAGEHHKGTGKNNLYSRNVERAIKWLIVHQMADGSFSDDGYEQALATLAMCEAYGMSADPILKGPAQRAINCCVAWQHQQGGFRYQRRTPGDVSVTGWFVQALKAGSWAGLNVPNATYRNLNEFLDSAADPERACYSYQPPFGQPAPTVTAIGMLSRQFTGMPPQGVGMQKGLDYIRKLPPAASFKNLYYYYFATSALRNLAYANPEAWAQWNSTIRDLLVNSQDQGHKDHHQKGSWSPEGDAWGKQLGRLGCTSLAVLTLEAYYRHLPLYRREVPDIKDR